MGLPRGGTLRLFDADFRIGTDADAGAVRHVEITLDDPSDTHAQQPGARQPFQDSAAPLYAQINTVESALHR